MSIASEERELIRERLAQIENANAGLLTPHAVVADAKKKDSPLHKYFEWDLRKAAAEHWLDQARQLIKTVRVEITVDHRTVKSVLYVRAPELPSDDAGYRSVEKLRADPDAARLALVAEFSRVAALLERARAIAIVLGAGDDVQSLIDGALDLRNRFVQAEVRV
jgi:hypothetical protein